MINRVPSEVLLSTLTDPAIYSIKLLQMLKPSLTPLGLKCVSSSILVKSMKSLSIKLASVLSKSAEFGGSSLSSCYAPSAEVDAVSDWLRPYPKSWTIMSNEIYRLWCCSSSLASALSETTWSSLTLSSMMTVEL